MAVDDDGAAVDTALSGGLAFGAEALRRGCGLPSVTVGAALVGRGDAALGSRWCDLQRGHVALGSGRALGVMVCRCDSRLALGCSVVRDGSRQCAPQLLGSWRRHGPYAQWCALGDDAFSATAGSLVTVEPSVAACGSPELPCESSCLTR